MKHLLIYINALCVEYNVDYDLVKAVIATESSWKHKAKSSAGALGLMQVLPSTALGEFSTHAEDLYDPYVNVTVGINDITMEADLKIEDSKFLSTGEVTYLPLDAQKFKQCVQVFGKEEYVILEKMNNGFVRITGSGDNSQFTCLAPLSS